MRLARLAASAFAGAAISFLAACAGAPAGAPAEAAPAAASVAAAPPAANGEAPQTAAVPAAAGVRALIGIDRAAVLARFGDAAFVRRDGPAEVWRYKAPECFLELFIYRERDGSQRVTHVDARNFAGKALPVEPCLQRFETERRG
jgi:hypothetical protein